MRIAGVCDLLSSTRHKIFKFSRASVAPSLLATRRVRCPHLPKTTCEVKTNRNGLMQSKLLKALPGRLLEAFNGLFQREMALSDRQGQVEQLLVAQAEPQVMKRQPHQGTAQRSSFVGIDEGVST